MPSPRGTWCHASIILALLLTALFLDRGQAGAYRFSRTDASSIPSAAEAPRWHPSVWGLQEELVWHVEEDPDWAVSLANTDEAVAFVSKALSVWSDVQTADIDWRVGGIVPQTGPILDGRNTISARDEEGSLAWVWMERDSRGSWGIVECDVALGLHHVKRFVQQPTVAFLIHELGHCLGLKHTAIWPTEKRGPRDSGIWWPDDPKRFGDPKMSYGAFHGNDSLSSDDEIGASLLRPAPGWRATTGSISGNLLLGDAPAIFVPVIVLRNDGGQIRPIASAFSDTKGAFLAEGLLPGDYFVWVHPMQKAGAHGDLFGDAAVSPVIDLDDTLAFAPILVRAGAETGELTFGLRRGRRLE